MTKDEAMRLLREGRSQEWNVYRNQNRSWVPDLRGEDLEDIDLVPKRQEPFDLSRANLCGAKLPKNNFLKKYRSDEWVRVDFQGALIDINTTTVETFSLVGHGAKFMAQTEKSVAASFSVFISYAWANDDVVLAIDQWLRTKGIKTKIDKRDFFAGSRIRDEIVRNMQQCDKILIFYSQQSKDKPWPQFERELASDLEMNAKFEGREPPRILYVVIDDVQLPSPSEANRIAITAKGKRFELVCEEIYHAILQIPRSTEEMDLNTWSDYVF